ncbi:hypothetical protein [Bacillus cereus group sp. BfR-BA-01524]|uniref:hypothetical protein n=1 Tax=Bacillus cereus group sp. BfR-BA-01524 TaxID=2920372 RepID=UPI001F58C443
MHNSGVYNFNKEITLDLKNKEELEVQKMPNCVDICVYTAPGANVNDFRINKDIESASAIWGVCGIKFNLKFKLPTPNNDDYNVKNEPIAANCDKKISEQSPKVQKLLNYRIDCPDKAIAVYYVAGATFEDGKTTGCQYFDYEYKTQNGQMTEKFTYAIILADGATPYVFAHELGHALFWRKTSPMDTTFIGNDPDDEMDPNNKKHNSNSCNLMHPTAKSTAISIKQNQTANNSFLIKECPPDSPVPTPSFPPENFRKIEIIGHMHILDDEGWPETDHSTNRTNGVPGSPVIFNLEPFNTHAKLEWVEKYGGEIRVEAHFDFDLRMDLSIGVSHDVKLFEGRSEDTGDLDGTNKSATPIIVPKDKIDQRIEVTVKNEDEDDDDKAIIVLLVSNKQQ